MFRPAKTPFDDLVEAATSENLLSEDLKKTIDVWEEVGRQANGPKDCCAALLKRLQHRNPNVALLALNVTDACVKNCGYLFHHELSTPAFLNTLVKMAINPATNPLVKHRILVLIRDWAAEAAKMPSLRVVESEYQNLRRQGVVFPEASPAVPSRSKEEEEKEQEELQMALALSLSEYENSKARSNASKAASNAFNNSSSSSGGASGTTSSTTRHPPTPSAQNSPDLRSSSSDSLKETVVQVEALYDFQGTEKGELPFRRGDIIDVIDKSNQDWWKGRLHGMAGYFPANRVKELSKATTTTSYASPEAASAAAPPSTAALVASLEASIDPERIDALATLLQEIDPSRKNIAEDDNIQDLLVACTSMKPKLVQLVYEYDKKREELMALSEDFTKAKSTYDALLANALARRSGPATAVNQYASRMNASSGPPPVHMQQQHTAAPYYAAAPPATAAAAAPAPRPAPATAPAYYQQPSTSGYPSQQAQQQLQQPSYGGYANPQPMMNAPQQHQQQQQPTTVQRPQEPVSNTYAQPPSQHSYPSTYPDTSSSQENLYYSSYPTQTQQQPPQQQQQQQQQASSYYSTPYNTNDYNASYAPSQPPSQQQQQQQPPSGYGYSMPPPTSSNNTGSSGNLYQQPQQQQQPPQNNVPDLISM